MSPFSGFLHDLRMRRRLRQADLADLLGYEQSYISALETGLKGPPTFEFLSRLAEVLALSSAEREEMDMSSRASQRKLMIVNAGLNLTHLPAYRRSKSDPPRLRVTRRLSRLRV